MRVEIKIGIMIYIAVCFLVLYCRVSELERECKKWMDRYFKLKMETLEREQEKWGTTVGVNPPATTPRPKHPGIK